MARALNVPPSRVDGRGPVASLRQELDRLTLQPLGLAAAVLLALLVSVWGPMVHEEHSFDHTYVHQAMAFAHGHTSIATRIFDTAERTAGCSWSSPGPALLLVPFVALWQTHVRVLLLTALLGPSPRCWRSAWRCASG